MSLLQMPVDPSKPQALESNRFFEILRQEILGLETERIKDSRAWSLGRMDNTCFGPLGHTLCDLSPKLASIRSHLGSKTSNSYPVLVEKKSAPLHRAGLSMAPDVFCPDHPGFAPFPYSPACTQ